MFTIAFDGFSVSWDELSGYISASVSIKHGGVYLCLQWQGTPISLHDSGWKYKGEKENDKKIKTSVS